MPAIIGDHMVLQQNQDDPIWGWDTPGTKITVSFAGQNYSTAAEDDGKWTVRLAPQSANAAPQTLTITGTTRREVQDVLIGEVWMCSGQSNMAFWLKQEWNGDLEAAAAKLPHLRFIRVPQVGTQELQKDFKGEWQPTTPDSAPKYCAVGFLFGCYLHQILNVPVGLIDNSWGSSTAEAWVRRASLENDPRFKLLMESTAKHEAELLPDQGKADFDRLMAEWKAACEKASAGHWRAPLPPKPWLASQTRPGNVFAGVLNPTLGYGIKGVIWYQGEANPVCNLFSEDGLPVTPFRTDDFEWITKPKQKPMP